MNLKVESIENALKAAVDIGLKEIPWAWIKFIQSGWKIHPNILQAGNCGAKWIWMRPKPHGVLSFDACVCHHSPDLNKLVDTKNIDCQWIRSLITEANPKNDDVGNIFYTHFESDDWSIVNRVEFSELDPIKIGWWREITDFDLQPTF